MGPQCDVLFAPLPSFAYISVLEALKPHLRKGHIFAVTPGQGGFDWIAYKVLGPEIYNMVTFSSVQPMPFNCRIDTWGRSVKVQVLKQRYDIACQPMEKMQEVTSINAKLFPKSENSTLGPILAATLVPLNAIIHPARLYTLLTHHHKWKPGVTLPENPLFYESMQHEDAANQIKVNNELDAIIGACRLHGVPVRVPDCYNFLAKTYDGVTGSYPQVEKTTPQDLLKLWSGPQYKGFRCPLKEEGGGWVPDWE